MISFGVYMEQIIVFEINDFRNKILNLDNDEHTAHAKSMFMTSNS